MPDSPRFVYDKRVNRYRYISSGRFVSQQVILSLTRDRIAAVKQDLTSVGTLLVEGKISLAAWEEQTAIALKILYIQNYTLHKGGEANMNAADFQVISQALREEYQYLQGFAEDIRSGEVSIAQFERRLKLYAAKGRYAAELARHEVELQSNKTYSKRLLGKNDRHCAECIKYAMLSWQVIGILPLVTQKCSCMSACQCSMIYGTQADVEASLVASNY